eukprot:11437113-Prorocentrum_lima.AAC.1
MASCTTQIRCGCVQSHSKYISSCVCQTPIAANDLPDPCWARVFPGPPKKANVRKYLRLLALPR